jgi:hypothetical protein
MPTFRRRIVQMPNGLIREELETHTNIADFSPTELMGFNPMPGSGAFEEVGELIGPELIDLDEAIEESEHDNRPFREGDEILQLRDCSGSQAGHTYTLVPVQRAGRELSAGQGGCSCTTNWKHVKPAKVYQCKKCKQQGAKFRGGFCKKCNSIAF